MVAKGEPTEQKERDRSTCAAKSVDPCFYRENSRAWRENMAGEGWWENMAGTQKGGGVAGKYSGTRVAGKSSLFSLTIVRHGTS